MATDLLQCGIGRNEILDGWFSQALGASQLEAVEPGEPREFGDSGVDASGCGRARLIAEDKTADEGNFFIGF